MPTDRELLLLLLLLDVSFEGVEIRLKLLLIIRLTHFLLIDLATMGKRSLDVLMLQLVPQHVVLVVLQF